MEQDIDILEELLNAKITFTISTTDYGWKALEHLIKAYKELEEENKDLKNLAKKYNMVYCEDYWTPYEDDNYGKIIQLPDEAIYINWRDDVDYMKKGQIYLNFDYKTTDKAYELLYDLIKANLVVKE